MTLKEITRSQKTLAAAYEQFLVAEIIRRRQEARQVIKEGK